MKFGNSSGFIFSHHKISWNKHSHWIVQEGRTASCHLSISSCPISVVPLDEVSSLMSIPADLHFARPPMDDSIHPRGQVQHPLLVQTQVSPAKSRTCRASTDVPRSPSTSAYHSSTSASLSPPFTHSGPIASGRTRTHSSAP